MLHSIRRNAVAFAALTLAAFAVITNPGTRSFAQNVVNVLNYMDQGGAFWHVGGTLQIESGGTLNVTSGGSFAVVNAEIDTGTKTATASSGAATLNKSAGVITSESLSTAAGSSYTLTLTDSAVAAADQVMASVALGTSTQGTPQIVSVTPAAGSVVIVVKNIHATQAFNGTILVAFVRFKN